MATLAELIAEDAVWHLGGRNSLTGDYEGREAIFGLFARLGQESEAPCGSTCTTWWPTTITLLS
jgi:ketosteroid isomerase-like protein